jgi:transposase InsO family protein
VVRYERDRPGEIIRIGWEFVHLCIDYHSRLAFSQVCKSEREEFAMAFLKAEVAWYKRLGIKIERVIIDNGSCYCSKVFNKLCVFRGIRHAYTKPYTPKTNGKAEHFTQSSLRQWAYAQAFDISEQRKKELPYWLHHYNWNILHAGIKGNQQSAVQAYMRTTYCDSTANGEHLVKRVN